MCFQEISSYSIQTNRRNIFLFNKGEHGDAGSHGIQGPRGLIGLQGREGKRGRAGDIVNVHTELWKKF